MIHTLTIIHAIISVILIAAVLLQFGKGAEAGLMESVSGASFTSSGGNIMTKITTVLAVLFLGMSVALSVMHGKQSDKSIFDTQAPATSQPIQPIQSAPVAPKEEAAPAAKEESK